MPEYLIAIKLNTRMYKVLDPKSKHTFYVDKSNYEAFSARNSTNGRKDCSEIVVLKNNIVKCTGTSVLGLVDTYYGE